MVSFGCWKPSRGNSQRPELSHELQIVFVNADAVQLLRRHLPGMTVLNDETATACTRGRGFTTGAHFDL